LRIPLPDLGRFVVFVVSHNKLDILLMVSVGYLNGFDR